MHHVHKRLRRRPLLAAALVTTLFSVPDLLNAQPELEERILESIAMLTAFTSGDEEAIPESLLQRARGIALIPGLIRGGFLLGGRRGKGVLSVRSEDDEWSNPAFVKLTGGSIGWQIGVETADVILVFANERAVRNIAEGKFTLGGDASAVAGPMGRHHSAAVTFDSEVYVYVRSQGLFAGAAIEGVRIGLDSVANRAFYGEISSQAPLARQSTGTPSAARRLLLNLERVSTLQAPAANRKQLSEQEAKTFPLE